MKGPWAILRYYPAWGKQGVHTEIWWGNRSVKKRFQDREVYGRFTLRWILGALVTRLEIAEDPVQWRILVLAVLNLRVLLPELVKC
jgi:hypothetical protein